MVLITVLLQHFVPILKEVIKMASVGLSLEGRHYIVRTDKDLFHPDLLPKTSVHGEADLVELAESGALFDFGDMLVFSLGIWHGVTVHFNLARPQEIAFEIDDTVDLRVVQSTYRQRLMELGPTYAIQTGEMVECLFHDDLENATT